MTATSHAEKVPETDGSHGASGSHPAGASGEVRALALRSVALVAAGETRLAVSRTRAGGA